MESKTKTPKHARRSKPSARAFSGFLVGPPLIGSPAEALSLRGALGVLGVLILAFGGAVEPKKGL